MRLFQENISYGVKTIALILCLHVAVHHVPNKYGLHLSNRYMNSTMMHDKRVFEAKQILKTSFDNIGSVFITNMPYGVYQLFVFKISNEIEVENWSNEMG